MGYNWVAISYLLMEKNNFFYSIKIKLEAPEILEWGTRHWKGVIHLDLGLELEVVDANKE